ncbi:DUF4178 domain-containing protein [Rhodovulum sp. DZ06]|uniref:DUF4178 domain-containing protein n=1 Tax=Rhodovulum sp. DZ06 TaxID=3425126 RepID=UPI003D341C75
MTDAHSCPNCGASVSPRLATSKVVTCDYCKSTIFLDDMSFRDPGAAGEIHDPSPLLSIDRRFRIGRRVFHPLGVVRYSYGRGTWDEFWCEIEGQHAMGRAPEGPWEQGTGVTGAWVSVDEGDVAVQTPVPPVDAPLRRADVAIGDRVEHDGLMYRAQEVETAECIGFAGELPEKPRIGETHRYVNFEGPDGRILSAETGEDFNAWFEGRWVDPWDVQRLDDFGDGR